MHSSLTTPGVGHFVILLFRRPSLLLSSHFLFSFSLLRRTSDPGSLSKALRPFPSTVRAFVFIARVFEHVLPSSTRIELNTFPRRCHDQEDNITLLMEKIDHFGPAYQPFGPAITNTSLTIDNRVCTFVCASLKQKQRPFWFNSLKASHSSQLQ